MHVLHVRNGLRWLKLVTLPDFFVITHDFNFARRRIKSVGMKPNYSNDLLTTRIVDIMM